LGFSFPAGRSWALGNPGRSLVPAPMTAGSWSVWARRSAVKRRTSSRVQPSWTRLAAAIRVPSRAITASVTGKAVARYQGRRRSTLWIRGPVAGRRTGRPWLRLLLPLMATLATPLPPSPLRPSGRDLTKRTARRLGLAGGRADRPHVRQVVGGVGEHRPVELRVLAQQARLVAAVQRRVAQPGRQGAGGGQLLLGPGGGHPDQGQLLPQLQLAGVGEPEHEPGPADRHPVAAQRLLVALPHQHRRMVAPAVAGGGQRPQHLERRDPLLAQTAWVKGPGAGGELGKGQERLQGHGSPVLAR